MVLQSNMKEGLDYKEPGKDTGMELCRATRGETQHSEG